MTIRQCAALGLIVGTLLLCVSASARESTSGGRDSGSSSSSSGSSSGSSGGSSSGSTGASGSASGGAARPDAAASHPSVVQLRQAMARGDWAQALRTGAQDLQRYPRNAALHHAYAQALMQAEQPYDAERVIDHLKLSAGLDPTDRDVPLELGKVFLQVRDLAAARQQLAALDRLCFFSCSQYRELKQAVSAYEAAAGPAR